MKENSKFKPLITYFIWLICFLLIQSVWAWVFLKFHIGDGFDLQKRILFRMGILEIIMLLFCWGLNHFYTHEKLVFPFIFRWLFNCLLYGRLWKEPLPYPCAALLLNNCTFSCICWRIYHAGNAIIKHHAPCSQDARNLEGNLP